MNPLQVEDDDQPIDACTSTSTVISLYDSEVSTNPTTHSDRQPGKNSTDDQ